MSVIWYKVWSDVWDNKVRTLLTVLSISAGVFAIGAIFGMVDQLSSGMNTAHQASHPSHINMFLSDRIERETATRLESVAGVADIEVLSSTTVRYKRLPTDAWQSGMIVMREDYEEQVYDTWQLKEGPWPKKKQFGIERLSSQFFNIDIGDDVIFEVGNSERAFEIISKIRHPFVEPPQFGGQAVFFTNAQGLERFGIPEGQFDQLLLRVTPYDTDLAQEVASEIKDRLAKENINVAITFYQDPVEHWGKKFVDGFNFVLQILAVVSLFLSVVLVTNTMNALVGQQTDQIGIMKAIGGTKQMIIKIYLSGVLLYGFLALCISLPVGALVAYGLTQSFLNFFNIDYEPFQISERAMLFQILAAITVPLLAALRPTLNGAAITVREAIASYGLGSGRFGRTQLDQFVEQVGERWLTGPYALALGNMFRRKGRLLLTQAVLITAGTMFLIVTTLAYSVDLTLTNDMDRRGFDIRIRFVDLQRIDRISRMAAAVPGVQQVEVWFAHNAALLKAGQRVREAGVGAQINGISAGESMFNPLMIDGRWLQPDDGRVVVISKDMADDHDVQVGDIITLNLGDLGDDEWQVVGIFLVVYNAGFDSDPIYAPREAVFEATKKHNDGSRLLVRTTTTDPGQIAVIFNQLKDVFEDRQMELNLFESKTTPQDRINADNQFSITINMLFALAIIVAIVGGMGLMGALSLSVVERRREIGVMRAIGAQSPILMGMLVMEGILQGLLSWLVSLPLSFIIGYPVAQQLGQVMLEIDLDYRYSYEGVMIWLGLILIISIMASILPARHATQISVRESLAYA